MPNFSTETYVYVNPCSFVNECTKEEKEQLIDALEDEGFIVCNSQLSGRKTIRDNDLIRSIKTIMKNSLCLSIDDQETINRIANKL